MAKKEKKEVKIKEELVIFNGVKMAEKEFLLKKQEINSKPGMRVMEVGYKKYKIEIYG